MTLELRDVILYNSYEDKTQVQGLHDPNSVRNMRVLFKPPVWDDATVYSRFDSDHYSVIIPTVFTGLFYKVKNPGKSGDLEPTWTPIIGQETKDGTTGLVWTAENYNFIDPGVDVSSVTHVTTHDVTVTNSVVTTSANDFRISALPTAAIAAGEFEITLRVTCSDGSIFDRTLAFNVGDT